jgi:hypothetical protein
LKRGDLGSLVTGQHFGDDGLDAELIGDTPGGGLVVAGGYDHLNVAATSEQPLEPVDHEADVRPAP